MKRFVTLPRVLLSILGGAILAFGLYNIHAPSGITEGGILGLTLLLDHHFSISPALSSLLLNLLCYGFGIRILGKDFLFYSMISGGSFSLFFALCERFPPLFPFVCDKPLLAALLGAVFIGVGVGLCVRCGGAPSGDDAFSMAASRLLKVDIRLCYLFSDLLVLGLSFTYLPFERLIYSLLTVILSGQLVGLMQPKKKKE